MKPAPHSRRDLIWRYIALCEQRGATCSEVEHALNIEHKTVSARINELHAGGRLTRHERRPETGPRRAYVYRIPDHALECTTCGLDNDQEAHRAWDWHWQTLTPDQQRQTLDALARIDSAS